ncbi:hypothetical protein Lser_V15G28184 [Lactuca serriola]
MTFPSPLLFGHTTASSLTLNSFHVAHHHPLPPLTSPTYANTIVLKTQRRKETLHHSNRKTETGMGERETEIRKSTLGQQLHACSIKMGVSQDIFVSCALIDMYNKCGSIEDAQCVFDEMPEKTTVGWNTIIAGYALHGYSEEHAKQAHAGLIRHSLNLDIVANTVLVDLYSKWGRIDDARNVFDKMPHKNIISWNTLIVGYGNHGRGIEALELFKQMITENMIPNHVTFLVVSSGCSYSGLSDQGWDIFESMGIDFKVKTRAMHYACMIELLGREGLLDEAFSLIQNASFNPIVNMWATLLIACRAQKNLELGKLATEKVYDGVADKLEVGEGSNSIVVGGNNRIHQLDGPIPDPYDDALSTPNIYNYQGFVSEDYNVSNTPAPQAATPTMVNQNDILDDDEDEPLNENDIDGAYFGTTFPHLFLMSYVHLKPQKAIQCNTPRVFGFKFHKPRLITNLTCNA